MQLEDKKTIRNMVLMVIALWVVYSGATHFEQVGRMEVFNACVTDLECEVMSDIKERMGK
jgi:hypothetical protein